MEKLMDTHVVIMAGGVGSRLWPMSVPEMPKQFVDVMGTGKSLLQMTVDRFTGVCPACNFWIVTSEKYLPTVYSQLPDVPRDQILSEPAARNTAPCIAYAAWKISMRHPDANVVVVPSDALVLDPGEFRKAIKTALDFTACGNRIVTIGIKPCRAETGYGYIEVGHETWRQEERSCCNSGEVVHNVLSFKEKPCLEVAEQYYRSGRFLWNAGIFVWTVRTAVDCIRRYTPSIASLMDVMSKSFYGQEETAAVGKLFPECEKISIDYAVMEKASGCIFTVPADFGWSDLGTWGTLRTLLPQDVDGNSVTGNDVRLFGCERCIVHAPDEKQVIVQGLKDCIVAEHGGKLLVCRLDHEQNMAEYLKPEEKNIQP